MEISLTSLLLSVHEVLAVRGGCQPPVRFAPQASSGSTVFERLHATQRSIHFRPHKKEKTHPPSLTPIRVLNVHEFSTCNLKCCYFSQCPSVVLASLLSCLAAGLGILRKVRECEACTWCLERPGQPQCLGPFVHVRCFSLVKWSQQVARAKIQFTRASRGPTGKVPVRCVQNTRCAKEFQGRMLNASLFVQLPKSIFIQRIGSTIPSPQDYV